MLEPDLRREEKGTWDLGLRGGEGGNVDPSLVSRFRE